MFLHRQRAALLSVSLALALAGAGLVATSAASAAVNRYEAETSPAVCTGTIDSNWAGFSGTGFCNGSNAVGAYAEFTVNAASAGSATLGIRYANGTTTDRLADIMVNGTTAQAAGSFAGMGAWDTWATKTVTVQVNAGNNTIRINPTTSNGLPNVDYLDVDVAGSATGRQVERLDRGLVSVRSGSGNLVSWRLSGTDPASVSFNLYRAGTRIFSGSLTNYFDSGASASASYTVRTVVNGVEGPDSAPSINMTNGYLDVPIQRPSGGTTSDGVSYTYEANDASVGDLDGDGVLEIVLKWNPTNAKDNAHSGYTGNVYIDAYKLNGTRMWRIDLGRNIRAGAHYTQFQVYDYDGDGRAEVAMKTADGSRSGTGQVIGNASADHRNSSGYILSGPEFLTIFNGLTGAAMQTINYNPPRGTVSSWGDNYGNRVDRFLAGTAYLDGQRPSMIFARGYYTRTTIWAVDWRNGQLTQRWFFDSNVSGSRYTGQGNHQLSIADLDNDGRDEIVYGAMAVNDNGAPLWSTGYGHGDSLHVGDLAPSRAGIEIYRPSEHTNAPGGDAVIGNDGTIVVRGAACNCDNGRGVAADVHAGSAGAEIWSAALGNLRSATNGATVSTRKPGSQNFLAWWDGDPVRELLDGNHIDKYGTGGDTRLLTGSSVHVPNGTKSTPSLSGDILGDWREEVIWPTTDHTRLRIYSTPIQTNTRLYTLLHDTQYRVAIAWQNTAYNQPPHPSYFIGNGMATPSQPSVYVP